MTPLQIILSIFIPLIAVAFGVYLNRIFRLVDLLTSLDKSLNLLTNIVTIQGERHDELKHDHEDFKAKINERLNKLNGKH